MLSKMSHHRILRFEHLPFLPHIRDLQHKLLTVARAEQKIPVALARQFARTRLNPEILFSYSLCEVSIHRFDRSQTRVSMLRLILMLLIVAIPVEAQTPESAFFNGLHYRLVGPSRGGRVTAVTGVRGKPNTYYFGATPAARLVISKCWIAIRVISPRA